MLLMLRMFKIKAILQFHILFWEVRRYIELYFSVSGMHCNLAVDCLALCVSTFNIKQRNIFQLILPN